MCVISLAVSRENWPKIMTFLSIFPTIKSFCRNLANFRNKGAVGHSEFSVLESLFPRFLGHFLACEMGWTCFYHTANDTAGYIETSLMSPLTMSAVLLCQELVPIDYLRQATCGTLDVMLNFDTAQHFAAKHRTQRVCRSSI